MLISTLAFLYSFSDQDRMERDYKIRECLTAILIGVCSMKIIDNFIKKTIKILFTINSLKKKKKKLFIQKHHLQFLSI